MTEGRRRSRFAPATAAATPDAVALENDGIYLAPFRVAALRSRATLERPERQRLEWETLRKTINGVVNRSNKSNAADCVVDLLNVNLVRGMGLLVRSLMRAQVVSHNFSPVYAAVVAAINTRLPELGDVLLARLIAQLKRGMEERDRGTCIASVRFVAHLYNQSVVDALLPLEIMNVLAATPTNDSIELVVLLMKECGAMLTDAEPRMVDDLFQMMRTAVQEGDVQNRVQYVVEGLMKLRRENFADFPTMPPGLDLIPDEDRIIHSVSFADDADHDTQSELEIFAVEKNWEEAEMRYAEFRLQVLGEDDNLLFEGNDAANLSTVVEPESNSDADDAAAPAVEPLEVSKFSAKKAPVKDMTEEELISFRRKVYLRIMSAASYEECAHKLAGFMRSHRGHEGELCNMILECCSQERTFMRYYGLLGQQFCFLSRVYVERFEDAFAAHYATIHRYDSRKIRNMANFYAFVLCADAIPWGIFGIIRMTEEETTSSSRIFLKYILLEMSQTLTMPRFAERLKDERLKPFLSGLFPTDSPANTRFSINFFTAIGLGPLTDEMREHLKISTRAANLASAAVAAAQNANDNDDDTDSSSLSDSSSSSVLSSSSSVLSDDDVAGGGRRGREAHYDRKRVQATRSPSPRKSKQPRQDEARGCTGRTQSDRGPQWNQEPRRVNGSGGRGRGGSRGRSMVIPARVNEAAEAGGGRGRGLIRTVPAWFAEGETSGAGPSVPHRGQSRRPVTSPNPRRGGFRSRSRIPPRFRDRSSPRNPSPPPRRYRDRSFSPPRLNRAHDRSLSPPYGSPNGNSSPRRRDRSSSPRRRDRIVLPARHDRSLSPLRRDRSVSPSRRERSVSPSRRDRSYSPRRRTRDRSHSPTKRTRSPSATSPRSGGRLNSQSPTPMRRRSPTNSKSRSRTPLRYRNRRRSESPPLARARSSPRR
jgi:pre-mRNA-splicing factor CWC22